MLKEPEIKLFGRKISLPEQGAGAAAAGDEWSIENSNGGGGGDCDRCFEESREEFGREEKQEQIDEELAEGEVCDTSTENGDDRNPSSGENPKNSPTEDDVESEDRQKSDNEATKGLKKPDKILPCPRCSSMDTKFCYYNNYNVNQPRHFCKSCQRYWTAGGTMRNVPVGAGRRKTKNSAPHCRHITISEPHHALDFRPTATVLSFAKDDPPGKPAPTAAAAAVPIPSVNGGQNGFHHHPSMNGFPCIPGVPWPFSAVPLPAVFPPGYPVPYYLWSSGGWNVPWMSPAASELTAAAAGTSPTSTLGKHPRSEELLQSPAMAEGERSEKKSSSIVVPKTLRIDDPEEAARSSIWSTLGINYDSVSREGLFKALQPKKQSMAAAAAAATAASSLMQANPAAMSRSLKFQEAA